MQSRTYKRVSWQLLRIVPYVIVISSLKIPLLGQSSFGFHGLNLSRNVLHDLFPFSLQSNIYSTKTLYLKKKNEFCILQKMLTNDWNNQTTSFFWILFFLIWFKCPSLRTALCEFYSQSVSKYCTYKSEPINNSLIPRKCCIIVPKY